VAGGGSCTSTFDVGAGGDFEVSGRMVHIFGMHSGDRAANENYAIFGIGSL
jgi:hypothetical protein